MYKVLAFALTLCLLQDTIAYCCFRDPYIPCCSHSEPEVVSCEVITYKPCAAPVYVPAAPCSENYCNPCPPVVCVPAAPCSENYCNPCSPNVYVPSPCCRNARLKSYGCVDPCPAFKPNPTSVCSCLKSLDVGGCGSGCGSCGRPEGDCGCDKPCIYFPEVEYPVTVCDTEPFYYNTCWCA